MKIIEVLISLVLIYALLSILVSGIVEIINNIQKSRGKMLQTAILQMLKDPLNLEYGKLLLKHPLINSMNNQKDKRPFQYLASDAFADAFIDIIGQQAERSLPLQKVKKDEDKHEFLSDKAVTRYSAMDSFAMGLDQMNDSPFKAMLLSFYSKSEADYTALKRKIARWFDNYMDRTSGWYKRKQSVKFRMIGFIIAFALNADSIYFFKVISMDDTLRKDLTEVAEGITKNYSPEDKDAQTLRKHQLAVIDSSLQVIQKSGTDSTQQSKLQPLIKGVEDLSINMAESDSLQRQQLDEINQVLVLTNQLGVPLGWNKNEAPLSWFPASWFGKDEEPELPNTKMGVYLYNRNWSAWPSAFWYIIGISLTGFLLGFGAPFWFDILIKFVNIRKAGKKPDSSTQSSTS